MANVCNLSYSLIANLNSYFFLYSATLPWPERVKRSIEKFEDQKEESRREQQVIGKLDYLV